MMRTIYSSLAALLVLVLASASHATLVQQVIFAETFNTNTADLATTTAAYPAFSGLAGTGSINVSSNWLQIVRGSDNFFLTNQSFNEEIWVNVDMGGFSNPPGNDGTYATALVIGNRAFQFFPGCCGGALRIYDFNPLTGAIGGQLTSPTNIIMPFTPAPVSMHHVLLHSDNLGGLDLTFTDGDTLNVYNQSFSFGGFIPGKVGFSALHGPSTSMFDNLSIEAMRAVPEPGTAFLLGGGLLLLGICRSGRRQQSQLRHSTPNSTQNPELA